jgi:hypothetical protein
MVKNCDASPTAALVARTAAMLAHRWWSYRGLPLYLRKALAESLVEDAAHLRLSRLGAARPRPMAICIGRLAPHPRCGCRLRVTSWLKECVGTRMRCCRLLPPLLTYRPAHQFAPPPDLASPHSTPASSPHLTVALMLSHPGCRSPSYRVTSASYSPLSSQPP